MYLPPSVEGEHNHRVHNVDARNIVAGSWHGFVEEQLLLFKHEMNPSYTGVLFVHTHYPSRPSVAQAQEVVVIMVSFTRFPQTAVSQSVP